MFNYFDFSISVVIELFFFIVLIKTLSIDRKNPYFLVINILFLITDILVMITVIISDLDWSMTQKGWYLGFFTSISFFILPWLYYWFMSNFINWVKEPQIIKFSPVQVILFIGTVIIDLLLIIFPNFIIVSGDNFDYDGMILGFQFMFWIIFLILYVIALDSTNRKINPMDQTIISKIKISAIIVFSTPVFYVIDSGLMLLTLLIYVIAYYFVYDGLSNYSINLTKNQNLL